MVAALGKEMGLVHLAPILVSDMAAWRISHEEKAREQKMNQIEERFKTVEIEKQMLYDVMEEVARVGIVREVPEKRRVMAVSPLRQNQEAKKREGKGREKERDKKRLSGALKQAETEQTVVKKTSEKMMSSSFQAADSQGPPSKRARRSAEVLSSCPWQVDLMLELPKPTWNSSEVMRKSGRPSNAQGSKMLPMGPLRCYARETIEVEQVGEGRGLGGGFIDDVVNGERLVVDRPVKEFAYYTLRLVVLFWLHLLSQLSIYSTGKGLREALRGVTMLKTRSFYL